MVYRCGHTPTPSAVASAPNTLCAMTHSRVTGLIYVRRDSFNSRIDSKYGYHVLVANSALQGGQVSKDALSCRSFYTKEPLVIGLFCRKCLMKIRHPMTLHHPVSIRVLDQSNHT